jgi:pyruvate-formate lyase
VVRGSGYSAYFNDLTNNVKDELIQRMTHDTPGNGCCR